MSPWIADPRVARVSIVLCPVDDSVHQAVPEAVGSRQQEAAAVQAVDQLGGSEATYGRSTMTLSRSNSRHPRPAKPRGPSNARLTIETENQWFDFSLAGLYLVCLVAIACILSTHAKTYVARPYVWMGMGMGMG